MVNQFEITSTIVNAWLQGMETAGVFPPMLLSILFHFLFFGIYSTAAFILKIKTTHQPPAQSGDLGRIDDDLKSGMSSPRLTEKGLRTGLGLPA